MSHNLFAWGAAFLDQQMYQHCSVEVAYQRGSVSLTVRAVVGSMLLKVADTHGDIRMERTDRDYIIRAEDLATLGEPRRGDLVRETVGTRVLTFEVMAYGSEQPARYSDITTRRTWRIHAKLVSTD